MEFYVGDLKMPKLNSAQQQMFSAWMELVNNFVEMKNNFINNSDLSQKNPPIFLIDDIFENFIQGSFLPALQGKFLEIYTQLKGNLTAIELMDATASVIAKLGATIKETSMQSMSAASNIICHQQLDVLQSIYHLVNAITLGFLKEINNTLIKGVIEFEEKGDNASAVTLLKILDEAKNHIGAFFKKIQTLNIQQHLDKLAHMDAALPEKPKENIEVARLVDVEKMLQTEMFPFNNKAKNPENLQTLFFKSKQRTESSYLNKQTNHSYFKYTQR